MSNHRPTDFLNQTALRLKAKEAEIRKLDTRLVEQDIAARRIEADVGWEFAQQVDRIEAALTASGEKLKIDQWCKKTLSVEITTMRRRKRLYKHWKVYESERRKAGQCGQSGLLFALSLIQDVIPQTQQTGKSVPVRSTTARMLSKQSATDLPISGCTLITGDALAELPRLPAQSVNTVVTSPPYFPAKRNYAGIGIGFETSLERYLGNLVAVFHEVHRVLKDDGTMWVNIDDSYHGGNLLFLPTRLALALQEDGWVCRSEVIWRKLGGGRPEPDINRRPTKDYERLFMFTKRSSGYFYDGDPVRVPLVRRFSTPGRKKDGMIRRDFDRSQRIYNNPMGRAIGSVWEITPASDYRGNHPATMAEELVRRCLLLSCPEGGCVLDPFGGAGTTALVAIQMGRQAISIEISKDYTQEARERIRSEFDAAPNKLAAD